MRLQKILLLYFSPDLWAEDALTFSQQASVSAPLTSLRNAAKNEQEKKFSPANVTVVRKYKTDI